MASTKSDTHAEQNPCVREGPSAGETLLTHSGYGHKDPGDDDEADAVACRVLRFTNTLARWCEHRRAVNQLTGIQPSSVQSPFSSLRSGRSMP